MNDGLCYSLLPADGIRGHDQIHNCETSLITGRGAVVANFASDGVDQARSQCGFSLILQVHQDTLTWQVSFIIFEAEKPL